MSNAGAPTLLTDPAVLRSLLEGEGIIDLRPADEAVPAPGDRLWLRPGAGSAPLKPAYQTLAAAGEAAAGAPQTGPTVEGAPAGSDDGGDVIGWVEVAAAARLSFDQAVEDALDGKTVLALSALSGAEVILLALRAHLLVEPLAPGALGADPAATPSEPALSDGAFEAKLKGLAGAVPWVQLEGGVGT